MRRPIGPQQPAQPRGIRPVAVGAALKPRAQDVGDALAAWMASGSSFYPVPVIPIPGNNNPVPGEWPLRPSDTDYGAIVCAYYVPPGHVGWVHDVEIAPYMAPGVATETTMGQGGPITVVVPPLAPGGIAGLGWHWQTGPVWEGLTPAKGYDPASWRWAILGAPGNVYRRPRGKVPAPALGVPVPWGQIQRLGFQAAYGGELPDGETFSRVPLVGAARGSEASWNVQIGEDTTIALVVRGRNSIVEVLPAVGLNPAYEVAPFAGSFGRLRGYQQKTQTEAARRNASRGLGS